MIDLTSIFYYFITLLAIIAVMLNIKKNHYCYYIWAVTNTVFVIQTVYLHAYNLVILNIVMLSLTFWGLYEWRFKKQPKTNWEKLDGLINDTLADTVMALGINQVNKGVVTDEEAEIIRIKQNTYKTMKIAMKRIENGE